MRVTLVSIKLNALKDDPLDILGDGGIQVSRCGEMRVAVLLRQQHLAARVAIERLLAGQRLVHGDAEGEDIHALIDPAPAQLLRGHVNRRTGIVRHLGRRLGDGAGEVKVAKPNVTVAADEDVLRLDVVMQIAAIMHVLERLGDVDQDVADELLKHGVGA